MARLRKYTSLKDSPCSECGKLTRARYQTGSGKIVIRCKDHRPEGYTE